MLHGFMVRNNTGETKLLKVSHRGDRAEAESKLTQKHHGIGVIEYLGSGSRSELAFRADGYLSAKGIKVNAGYSGQGADIHV